MGGTGYENGETIQIAGTALGGVFKHNVTFKPTELLVDQMQSIDWMFAARVYNTDGFKPFINIDAIEQKQDGRLIEDGQQEHQHLTVFDSTATFMN